MGSSLARVTSYSLRKLCSSSTLYHFHTIHVFPSGDIGARLRCARAHRGNERCSWNRWHEFGSTPWGHDRSTSLHPQPGTPSRATPALHSPDASPHDPRRSGPRAPGCPGSRAPRSSVRRGVGPRVLGREHPHRCGPPPALPPVRRLASLARLPGNVPLQCPSVRCYPAEGLPGAGGLPHRRGRSPAGCACLGSVAPASSRSSGESASTSRWMSFTCRGRGHPGQGPGPLSSTR